ncbi:MOSC domain-containing protein [Sulfitobacter sabulilitoris]|uniref:MOSC domain-containing protein n=1 Tax=Sulfitobacter sabulilitoris TaxID=2562655 RepID=A0A5S3P7X6_9RHOB|nr:MOSC N-terminal beta barrel domain-containing protein [Sulfitobacter sabulilitoris]TMM49426.1 MOSC domain-containing protein [Sulfitobacter sabulilitoris]
MITLRHLLRYPLKSHGREAVDKVELTAGAAMPWDRVWAVAHDASHADGSEWAACVNFSRVSKAPQLMAITATFDAETEALTLAHPLLSDLTFHPDTDAARFIDWVMPLVPQDRALPDRILRLDGRGFTDSDFASVTLCNLASHRAVERQIGHEMSIHRWRGNIWVDGAEPWAEFDWIGRDLRLGGAVLRGVERTDRCLATTANPDNGLRDADTLGALDHWGHNDFSIRAAVIESGPVAVGDRLEVI